MELKEQLREWSQIILWSLSIARRQMEIIWLIEDQVIR
jgi:hypothetical protein